MGLLIEILTIVFLITGTVTQLISFLTPNMYKNNYIQLDHQGLFRRCGLFSITNSPFYIINKLLNDPHNVVNSMVGGPSSINGCYWWDFDIFHKEPRIVDSSF
jgi:hypothetical protein